MTRAGIALLLIAALSTLACPSPDPAGPEPEQPETAVADAIEPLPVDLYFPSADDLLVAEAREIPRLEDVQAQAEELVRTLLAGPENPALFAPLGAGAQLGGTFVVAERGRLIVDLRDADGSPPPPSGSRRELLAVYSVVNTVLLNLEDFREVVLLWNGRQSRSFSGHVDTAHPLTAAPEWIAASGTGARN